ncbi:hypothetical protein I552_8130 [Mycobacterium xenopi 3993]|nr:hypothetical protein I552_8130 [Mycobacterium xenopi 3993]
MNLTRDLENTVDHDPAEGSHVQAGLSSIPAQTTSPTLLRCRRSNLV